MRLIGVVLIVDVPESDRMDHGQRFSVCFCGLLTQCFPFVPSPGSDPCLVGFLKGGVGLEGEEDQRDVHHDVCVSHVQSDRSQMFEPEVLGVFVQRDGLDWGFCWKRLGKGGEDEQQEDVDLLHDEG